MLAGSNTVFVEMTRYLEAGRPLYNIQVTERAAGMDTSNMALIGGDDLTLSFSPNSLCPTRDRTVRIEPFWIDKYEVTNAQYRDFVEATDGRKPRGWDTAEQPDTWDTLPVVNITYNDATAYCEWVGKRLPTHPEWELAA